MSEIFHSIKKLQTMIEKLCPQKSVLYMIKLIHFHVDNSIFAVIQNSGLKLKKTSPPYIFYPYNIIKHFVRHISYQKFGMVLFIDFVLFINSGLTNLAKEKLSLKIPVLVPV